MSTIQNLTQDLSNRAIYKITGSDAERYLNGQVSQDVRLASENEAVYSIVATFKGKLEGDFFIRKHNGDIIIDTCASQRESLFNRLDKYLVADDAIIEDISDQFQLCHQINVANSMDYPSWKCNRYGIQGIDYLLSMSDILPDCDDHREFECLRITHKIPAWGSELNENILPAEAHLENRAISYNKGCYTGQEIISRMKSAGKTNKHLVNFSFYQQIKSPQDLTISTKAEDNPTATLTSSCEHEGKWIGLGYRTRKAQLINTFYTKDEKKIIVL